jgi:hypothetical protein
MPDDDPRIKSVLEEEQGSSPYATKKAMRQGQRKEGDQHVPLIEGFCLWRPLRFWN